MYVMCTYSCEYRHNFCSNIPRKKMFAILFSICSFHFIWILVGNKKKKYLHLKQILIVSIHLNLFEMFSVRAFWLIEIGGATI